MKVETDLPPDAFYVGQLLTYEGAVERHENPHVRRCAGSEVLDLAERVKWNGRLWRDPNISYMAAWDETWKFLSAKRVYVYRDRAFVVFDEPRIVLISVARAWTGRGYGSILARHVSTGNLIAGTYADNVGARRLYKKLGMKIVKRELVFHK